MPAKSLTTCLLLALTALPALPARAQDPLVIDGATGVLPLARALVSAYREAFPDARVDVGTGLGTAVRLQALADGKIHIAVASHGVTPEAVRAGGLTVVPIARGAVVFAVNASISLAGLTEAQVCDVYRGEISSWRPLGGPESPIVVLTRPAAEVDQEVIRATIGCFKDLQEVASARVMPGGGDMARGLAGTPHAIGMTSMTVVSQSGGKVRALSLGGIAPTPEHVRSGKYALTRDFMFVVKGEPAGAVRRFLEFVHSDTGARVILANGAVPVR